MARTRRTPKKPTHFYRCRLCHSPIPVSYSHCTGCGANQQNVTVVNTVDELRREYDRARLEQLAQIGHCD